MLFYSLRGIILQLQKELSESGFENMFKITKKSMQGMLKTISFSMFYFPFYNFLNLPFFFAFLVLFTAAENLKVAGDSAGHRRTLTTLGRGTHITRNMCSWGRGTHITRNMYSWVGEHISPVTCVSCVGGHISLGICVSRVEKHISLVTCVSRVGVHTLLGMCVPLPGVVS